MVLSGTAILPNSSPLKAFASIHIMTQRPPRSVSKQQAVIPSQVFELPDGSSSYQDFSLTRNNRFSSAQSSRNIIQAPAAVLHFYNAPPTLSQHQLHKVAHTCTAPWTVRDCSCVGGSWMIVIVILVFGSKVQTFKVQRFKFPSDIDSVKP